MQPSLMCIEGADVERSERNVLLMGDEMEMKAELEDKPNLFFELVAWRQFGFNVHWHRTSEQKASDARKTLMVQRITDVMYSCGLTAELGIIAGTVLLEGQIIQLLL